MKRRMILIVAAVLTLMTSVLLSSCDDSGHKHTYTETVVPPTCTEAGYTAHKCDCGESYNDTEVQALGHDEIPHAAKEPNCTEVGWEAYDTCSRCDYTTYVEKPISHDIVPHSAKEPTCTVAGWEAYETCSKCDYTTYVEKPGSHNIIQHSAKAPTCTEVGWDAYEACSKCDYTTYVEKATIWHECDESGNCTDCDYYYSLGLEYTLNGEEYSVSGIGNCTDTDIVIPLAYNNLPVTSIDDRAFQSCRNEDPFSITIPDSVKKIGDFAFFNSGIYRLTIENSVTSIGAQAFSDCDWLGTVALGNGVTSIGGDAFARREELRSISVDENNLVYKSIDGNLYTKDGKTLIQYAIGKTESSFIIPDFVTSISDSAFSYCSNLTDITIPDSVISMGNDAFIACQNLTYNEYDNAYYIGNEDNPYLVLFRSKSIGISSCNIHSETRFIHSQAFGSCSGITNITIPDSIMGIGRYAFWGNGLVNITIGENVTKIDDYAFSSCKSLVSIDVDLNNANYKSIDGNLYTKDGKKLIQYAVGKNAPSFTVPDSVKSIGGYAFYYSAHLESVVIPSSVESIGDYAFSYCKLLQSASIGNSVTSIGRDAFSYCERLPAITIPDSVIIIGDYAFRNCKKLSSVTIGSSVRTIGTHAFAYCDSLMRIDVDLNNANYKSIDGNLYTKDGKILIQYAIGKTDTSFTVPQGVATLGSRAFAYCSSLGGVTISSDVTSISEGVFWGCANLKSVTIPNSVASIAESVFADCTNFESINYCGTEEQWNTISKSEYWDTYVGDYTIIYNYVAW